MVLYKKSFMKYDFPYFFNHYKIMSTSKNTIIKIKKELPPMKVIEPFKVDVREFDNKEDFIRYVNEDMEKYKAFTTQKLNKMFHIPGYRITKLQGEISLRAKTTHNSIDNEEQQQQAVYDESLRQEIETIKKDIETLRNAYNQLISELHLV